MNLHAIKNVLMVIAILYGNMAFCQYTKDTIYLKFEPNSGKNPSYKGIKFYKKDEKGIVFNLLYKGSLLFPNEKKSDTLSIDCLKNYPITTMEEVEQKVKDFRVKTYKKEPPNKNDKLYQAYTKNDIFKTYLIEIIGNDRFVIYPVSWRNQNIIE